MSKGSHRRPENAEAIRRNWPFPEPPRAPVLDRSREACAALTQQAQDLGLYDPALDAVRSLRQLD